MIRMVIVALSLLLAVPVMSKERAGAPWELVKTNKRYDIKIYTRRVDGYAIKEFKAVTTVKSSLSAFAALFEDTERMPAWVYRVHKSFVVKRISETEAIAYTALTAPWPIKDRDAIVYSWSRQNPKTLELVFSAVAKPDFLPQKEGYVRILETDTDWTFRPLGKGEVEVTFRGYGDPGGAVPDWAANLVITDMPYNTMKGLHRVIDDAKYQGARYNYIRESAN